MRYIDTGTRDAEQTLGAWLDSVLLQDGSVTSMRLQTGFFSEHIIGYFRSTLERLRDQNGEVRLLIGSNDGLTTRRALESLLAAAGPPRSNLCMAVVSFMNGYFHPKVFHFQRNDGSQTAYVGSANLTREGACRHVEAGLILDSRSGDDETTLRQIADAIDGWFGRDHPAREGLFPFSSVADLVSLEVEAIIDVARSPAPPRLSYAEPPGSGPRLDSATLYPLLKVPGTVSTTDLSDLDEDDIAAQWSKTLSRSDAQRKDAGNQRGAVTLVQGNYRGRIDQSTYFRYELFGSCEWRDNRTNTGKPMQVAVVPMRTSVDLLDLGVLTFKLTYESERESKQRNYTTVLHLEPLTAYFKSHDMTGRTLEITLSTDGRFNLKIVAGH